MVIRKETVNSYTVFHTFDSCFFGTPLLKKAIVDNWPVYQ